MKKVINTNKAPLSTSPVSQCNVINGNIYIGGQMPRDMETGKIVDGPYEQTKLSLEHCLAILKEAGGSIDTIAMAIVYVTDLSIKDKVNEVEKEIFKDDFYIEIVRHGLEEEDKVNEVFAEYFPKNPPARNLVEVSDIGEGALIEIAIIASEIK